MRGGSAFYCPACRNRQTIGNPGEKIELPIKTKCERCGAAIVLEKSLSGGAHPRLEAAPAG